MARRSTENHVIRSQIASLCLLALVHTIFNSAGQAQATTISLPELALIPASGTTNVLDIQLDAGLLLGRPSDQTTLTGFTTALLDLELENGVPVPVGLSLTGGVVHASDLSFSFSFGITASTMNLAGTASSIQPPSAVTDGMFRAADHEFELNQGSITAGGSTIQLDQEPFAGVGQGLGTVTLTQVGPVMGSIGTYDVTVALPIQIQQEIPVPNVPLLGTVNIDLDASGTIVSQQRIEIPLLPGDFDGDGNLDCLDLDALTTEILAGTNSGSLDVTDDQLVNLEDLHTWLLQIKGTTFGDANLDLAVDALDFDLWKTHRFSDDSSFCHGDFNVDGIVDGVDFGIWNQHRTATDRSLHVPEPSAYRMGLLMGLVAFSFFRTTT